MSLTVITACRVGNTVAQQMIADIVAQEGKAERSLMHRFSIAHVSHLGLPQP